MSEGRLSADRHEALVKIAANRSIRRTNMLVRELTVSGRPPHTVPQNSPFEQYQQLVAAMLSGDPRFTQNLGAQARLRELEQQFGPAPQRQVPFGPEVPTSVAAMLAATAAAQKYGGGGQPTPPAMS